MSNAKRCSKPLLIVLTLVFTLVFIIGWPCVQVWRYREAARPFREVGAWVYSGGDDMGVPIHGPQGIREIYFYDKEFGDAEMKKIAGELKKYPQLRRLHLQHTQITDASLKYLTSLPIQHLDLSYTRTSEKAVEDLKQGMPNCHVRWESLEDWMAEGQPIE